MKANAFIYKNNLSSIKKNTRIANDEEELEFDSLSSNIKIINDKILFYSDIDDVSILELNKALLELDLKLQQLKLTLSSSDYTPTIHLHINTGGGSIHSAFAAVDTIRNLKSQVHTYIDGNNASAGTLISIIGHKRYMGLHSHLLIHQLSSEVYGKFQDIEDEFYNCSNLMNLLKQYYKKYTKIPMKKLEDLLKKDIWLTAEECLTYGIVDEIL